MIDEIQVRNLALIRDVSLVPGRGLTVLTGETGAGKTAVVSALKLLMGGRADKDAVRDGADSLEVSGRFFDAASEELVIRRSVTSDGRSRASINGGMASMGELGEALSGLVDLCGQHDQQQLLKTSNHIDIFDAWAASLDNSFSDDLEAYQQAFEQEKAAHSEYLRLEEASRASVAELDQARFTLKRINEVDPQPGEYENLQESLSRAENAEALAQAAYGTHEALSGENGAIDALNAAISALDTGARYDAKLGKLADTLRESTYVLEDTAREVCSYQDDIEFDPETLQLQQERMSAMQGLLRVYGPRMEDVFAARDAAAEAVSLVDNSASRLKQAKKACDEAAAETDKAAEKLDTTRKKLAPQFASGVTDQMQHMEMQGASLHVSLERIDRGNWTQKGPSSLEFTFCPGEGLQARSLAKIASGGELSRVLLAIKVVLGAADPADTLVFDEVDAGVGGSAAVALADVLESLSQNHQVIVVTHLAQVAARAQVHAKVEKRQGSDGLPETALRQLTKEERPAEIARMLSGSVTQVSLAHARELIAE